MLSTKTKKPPKYGNTRTVLDGIKFASAKESRRYAELKLLERAGLISALELQPSFILAPGVTFHDGEKKRSLRYVADFSYRVEQDGDHFRVVEDVKSEATRKDKLYRTKKHLMKSVLGLDITES